MRRIIPVLNNEVHAVGKWQRNQNTTGPMRNVISDCKYYGGEHGWKKEYCPAYGKICDHCGKKNHFAAMCLQRKHAGKREYNTTHHVQAVSKSTDDILYVDYDAQGHLHIRTVSKSQYKAKLFAQVKLFFQTIAMQIDTWASCNVLPTKYVPLAQCAQPWNLLNFQVLSRTSKLIFPESKNPNDYNEET